MRPADYDDFWKDAETVMFLPLTQGKFAVIDAVDYPVVRRRWYAAKIDKGFYAISKTKGPRAKQKTVYMHRVIVGLENTKECDHRNRNGLDNRRSNLRIATRSQNEANKARVGKSGFKGVTKASKCAGYVATVCVAGRPIRLGRFKTAEEAARRRDEEARKIWGEFAYLNFPQEISA